MLRPFKSILTYLQLNTNTSEMNQENSVGTEIVSTEISSEKDCSASINTNENSSLTKSPLKTPHDQNENEVVIIENENESTGEKKMEDFHSSTTKSAAVDLTDNSNDEKKITTDVEEITKSTACGACEETVTAEINENTHTESNESVEETSEQDGDRNSQNSANVNVLSDDDKETVDSDIYIVPENAEQRPDIAQIVLSDSENAEESKNETIDLSLESNEVIILEETDPNDSLSDPLNDPLAIDDYTADGNNSVAKAQTSGGHSNPSNEGELLFALETRPELDTSDSKSSNRSKHDSDTETSARDVSIEEHEVRSDGSDSGLGSESSALQSNNSSLLLESPTCKPPPAKGNLKRRSDEVAEPTANKRVKNSINFNGVKVYYFPRIQGFGCVPSQGGCTLGMAAHHIQMKTFSLAEHTAEQRRVHKQQMQEINPRTSSSDETDSDEEISEASGSDLDADASGFLQPVSPRQRRAILKAAGIRKIDSAEKDECRAIRSSREFCGCNCRGYCDPDTCSCSQSGIKCQVDRPSFPCGCTRDGCANVVGRVEFNPSRVRTHYIHTIMRLDIENKQKRAIEMDVSSTSSQILNYDSTAVTSTLSSLCTYNNLVTTNHMRHQEQMYIPCVGGPNANAQHHTHDNYVNHNNDLYSSVASSIMPSASNAINASTATLLRQRLLDQSGSVSRQGINSRNTTERFTMDMPCASGENHELDLHYEFRDDSSATVDLTSPSGSTDLLELSDYNSTTSLYHETYNGHSFLNQNYSNPTFCQTQSISTYQQSFIGYVPPSNSSTEIANLELPTEPDKAATPVADHSYLNINSPASNQSRLDVKSFLQSHRELTVTTMTVPPAVIDSSTTLTYNMAPSAQTSTSITEGTLTTVSLPKVTQSTKTFDPVDAKVNLVVDLTDRVTPEQEKTTHQDESTSSEDVIEILEGPNSGQNDKSLTDDSAIEPIKARESLNCENTGTSTNITDTQSDIDLTISENTSISSAASVEENLIIGTAIA